MDRTTKFLTVFGFGSVLAMGIHMSIVSLLAGEWITGLLAVLAGVAFPLGSAIMIFLDERVKTSD